MLRWDATTIGGVTRYCCRLPDGRWAYVEPSRQPGRFRLRILSRPGQAVADLYLTKPSVVDCMRAAERHGRRAAA